MILRITNTTWKHLYITQILVRLDVKKLSDYLYRNCTATLSSY